ncbi:hypothetical protein [Methanocorpusculum labreanum]|uniref:hypothetical protein n=1 Tax=Methanocorpusculum labreanum TaxID=83984 RepID=UPI0003214EAD|nr:hypothetical protein [Methanocorpusculum labreanum]
MIKIAQIFSLYVGEVDRKTFEAFSRKYPRPHTSKMILGLMRKHLNDHGEPDA